MNEQPALKLCFKPSLYTRKPNWSYLTREELLEHCNRYEFKTVFGNGGAAIWTRAFLYDEQGKQYIWIVLDVEDLAGHGDISSNIRLAQELLVALEAAGLTDDLEIALSGSGLRFLWPYWVSPDLKRAFMSFARHLRDKFHCLDLAPFTNKSHYRLFGYRGHRSQDQKRPLPNKHVHLLDNKADLLDLDESKYLDLVHGKPNADLSCEWLERVLPREEINWMWFETLKQWEIDSRYDNAVIRSSFPAVSSSAYSTNWEQIRAFIDSENVATEFTSGDATLIRLETCPSCGQGEGRPYITPNGFLKCRRENTCPARASEGGLPPSEWVPDYEPLKTESELLEPEPKDTISIEAARAEIRQALNSDQDVIVPDPPGVGKTHETLQYLKTFCTERLCLYSTPNYRLALEVRAKALEMFQSTVPVVLLEGRHDDKPEEGLPKTCERMDEVNRDRARGYPVGLTLCPGCSWHKADLCIYQKQFAKLPKKAGLIITTHAQAVELLKDETKAELLWIIDEDITPQMLEGTETTLNELMTIKTRLDEWSASVLDRVQHAGEAALRKLEEEKGKQPHIRLYATERPNYDQADLLDLWQAAEVSDEDLEHLHKSLDIFKPYLIDGKPEPQRDYFKRLKRMGINYNMFVWLIGATYRSPLSTTCYLKAQKSEHKPLVFVNFWKRKLNFAGRIVYLDGTADPQIIKSLFPGREFHYAKRYVDLPNVKKIWLKRCLGKVKAKKLKDEQTKDLLKEWLKQSDGKDTEVLVATFKDVEQRVLNLVRELDPGRTYENIHYYLGRGINDFEHFTTVLCFGIPTANPGLTLDAQMALFPTQKERDEYFEWLGWSELVQICHRIRLVYGDKKVVLLGRTWPVDELGKPDQIIDLQRKGWKIKTAVERLVPWVERFGFVTKDVAAFHGIGTKGDVEHFRGNKPVTPDLRMSTVYRDYLITVDIGKNRVSTTPIHPNGHQWQAILTELENRFPGCGRLQMQIGNHWTNGAGSLDAVRRFYTYHLGRTFEASYWKQTSDPVPKSKPVTVRARVLHFKTGKPLKLPAAVYATAASVPPPGGT